MLASGGLVVATRARRRGAQPPAPPGVRGRPGPQRHRPPAAPVSTEVVTPGATRPQPERVPPAEQAPSRPVLKERLGRARGLLAGYLDHVRGRNAVDDATFEELEEALILADVGITTTTRILDELRAKLRVG